VIVSQRLAERLWHGVEPIGKRLHLGDAPQGATPRWLTVVGVVEDARYRELTDSRYDLYLPFGQALPAVKHYVVRTPGDPMAIVPVLRETVKRVDSRLAIENVTTMEQIVGQTIAPWRFSTVVFTAFACWRSSSPRSALALIACTSEATDARDWHSPRARRAAARRRPAAGA
jgi:hypothetical protein